MKVFEDEVSTTDKANNVARIKGARTATMSKCLSAFTSFTSMIFGPQ